MVNPVKQLRIEAGFEATKSSELEVARGRRLSVMLGLKSEWVLLEVAGNWAQLNLIVLGLQKRDRKFQ